ncbi:hypothetical protein [Hyalangium gracile]|uniref:hypothetical protein n=1 Tax=Hyalangium gracile TaxID=394092 RepID=UPI001CCCDF21|nr:hypothetical protein [Hyalangium gracile]
MIEEDLAPSPEGMLRSFELRAPGAVKLARCLSLASRIEPELLRWMRLQALPDVDAAAEAALWFSPLVQVRSMAGLVLVPELARVLRAELFQQGSLLARAWSELQRFHQSAPRAVQLEERLLYLSLPPPSAEVDEEIQRLLAEVSQTLSTPGREGVAAWALQLLAQLPPRIIATDAARRVSAQSHLIVSGRLELALEPRGGLPEWLPGLLPKQLPHIPVYLRLDERTLSVHGGELPGAVRLDVPGTNPLLLEVEAEGTRHLLSFEPGESRALPITQESVELRTVTGKRFRLGRRALEEPGDQANRLIEEQREELKAYLASWALSSGGNPDWATMEKALQGLRRFGLRNVVGAAVAAVEAIWRLISPRDDGEAPDVTRAIEESLGAARRILNQRVGEAAPYGPGFIEDMHRMEERSQNGELWLKTRCAAGSIEAALAASALFGNDWPMEEEATDRAAQAIMETISAMLVLGEHLTPSKVIHEAIVAELLREPPQVPGTWSPSGLWVQVLGTARSELRDVEMWTAYSLGRALALHGHRLVTDGSRGTAYVVARAYAAQLTFLGVPLEDNLAHIRREGERGGFPHGHIYRTSLPDNVSQRISASIIMGDARLDTSRIEQERHAGVRQIPLAWAGGAAAQLLPRLPEVLTTRQARFLDSTVRSQNDAMQMAERAVMLASIPPRSKRPTNEAAFAKAMLELMLSVVLPGGHTLSLGDYLRELHEAAEAPDHVWKQDVAGALRTLQAAMPQQAQWLAYDFVRLCGLQRDEDGVVRVVELLRPLVVAYALSPALGALGRELGNVDLWAPREVELLLARAAHALLGATEEFERWLVAKIGITNAELEFRFVVASVRETAVVYLRSQSPSASDFVAQDLRENLRPALPIARPDFVHRLVVSQDHVAMRVVAYVLFQLQPGLATSKAVIDALMVEQAEAERFETRPLLLLLVALSQPLSHWRDDERRAVAEALSRLLAFFDANPRIERADGQGGCKERLNYLLFEPFRTAYEEMQALGRYARKYEELRETQQSSPKRTQALDLLVFELGTLVRRTRFVPAEIKARFALGTPGDRLVALAILQFQPEPECFYIVLEGILGKLSSFEQWAALNAAKSVLPLIDLQQRRQLARALWEQRSGKPGASITRKDAGRWNLSSRLLEQLRQLEPSVSTNEEFWKPFHTRLLELHSPDLDDVPRLLEAAKLMEDLILEAGRQVGVAGPLPLVERILVDNGQLSAEEHEAFQKFWDFRSEIVHSTVRRHDPRFQQMLDWVLTLVDALD